MLFAELFAGSLRRSAGSAASSRPRSRLVRAASICSAQFTRAGRESLAVRLREPGRRFFPASHASYKFCLLSLTGKALREPAARFAFFLWMPQTSMTPAGCSHLSPEELALINPNTGTLPIFRNRRDALYVAIYRRIPVL